MVGVGGVKVLWSRDLRLGLCHFLFGHILSEKNEDEGSLFFISLCME
jgi:hypothetical protein